MGSKPFELLFRYKTKLVTLEAKIIKQSANFDEQDQAEIYIFYNQTKIGLKERSGSVVKSLTQDQGASGSSLTGFTELWSLSKTHLS